ncbi:MAG: LytTR family transcriptional regulator [Clostridia bacterium]|nr:LytTR family transcriptional regulator [Clostridia bacterium]
MIFKLQLDRNHVEEIVATVHQRTALIDEIERLVTQDNLSEQIPGYEEDEIVMLNLKQIDCFFVEDERTYAHCQDGKQYLIRRRLYELEKNLPGYYERISKSAIANWPRISRFRVQLSGAVDAVFKSGYTECISRRCFAELKRRYGL